MLLFLFLVNAKYSALIFEFSLVYYQKTFLRCKIENFASACACVCVCVGVGGGRGWYV